MAVLRNIFLVSCVLLACSALFPVLWHLWIYAGSANSNFYYAITLLFSVAQVPVCLSPSLLVGLLVCVCLSVCLSACLLPSLLSHLPLSLPVCLPLSLPFSLSVSPSVNLSAHLTPSLYVSLSDSFTVCPSPCLSDHSTCLSRSCWSRTISTPSCGGSTTWPTGCTWRRRTAPRPRWCSNKTHACTTKYIHTHLNSDLYVAEVVVMEPTWAVHCHSHTACFQTF